MLRKAFASQAYSFTENGADTYASSNSSLVDFFFKAGAARNLPVSQLISMFNAARASDEKLAFQTLLWLRDARGGAGERAAFRNIVIETAKQVPKNKYLGVVIQHMATFGRFDDLLVLVGTQWSGEAIAAIFLGLHNPSFNGLAAKWMPRQGKVANILGKAMGLTPRNWRKFVVSRSNTVEQKMCSQDWGSIDYNKVPSVASARYRKAFHKHDEYRYSNWAEKLASGETKVNASVLFPHDIIRGIECSDARVTQAQWEALPNYMEGHSVLSMVDVSGSMMSEVSGNVRAMDISTGLGLYTAMKQEGPFKNMFMTFSSDPQMCTISTDNIVTAHSAMLHADWGLSTDLQKAFELLLKVARSGTVAEEHMPKTLLILSDMEFNECVYGTNMTGIRHQYLINGYKLPNIVFWNLNSYSALNSPIKFDEEGTALISGYSPSILKGLLKGNITPKTVFLDTVDIPRYQVF